MRFILATFFALSLTAMGACKAAKKSSPAQDDAASLLEKTAPTLPPIENTKSAMQQHFVHAITAKDTLLFGHLDVANDSLRWLADNGASEEEMSESWEPHVGRIRVIAKDALPQKNLAVMAMAVAQIARECGSCHAALSVEPKIPLVKEEPMGNDFKDHMIGHKWALDRMWAGLTTPSSERWQEGAGFLADKPTHFQNLSRYGKDADTAMDFASSVHQLGKDALEEDQSDRRMAIFGRFLSACAGCHALPAAAPPP